MNQHLIPALRAARFLFGRLGTAHERLLWFGIHGKAFMARIIRMLALATVVLPICAIIMFRYDLRPKMVITCTYGASQPVIDTAGNQQSPSYMTRDGSHRLVTAAH